MQQICEVRELAAEFLAWNLNEEYHLGDGEANRRILLKIILRRQSVEAYSGFMAFEIK